MNNRQKTFIVGDVHGCFNELLDLLDKAQCRPMDHRIILLGDLINKGPDSFKVLVWAKKNQVEMVLGNHELKLIQSVEEQSVEKKKSLSNPSGQLDSFNQLEDLKLEELKNQMGVQLMDWINWIKTWPLYIEEKDFLAVHGGLIPGEHPSQSQPEWLVNIRYWDGKKPSDKESGNRAWHDLYRGSKLVVYAHWAKQGLTIKKNSIGLDTGCVYGGKLTGLWLKERKIVQVPSHQIQATHK